MQTVSNWCVYDLNESLVASGYPMQVGDVVQNTFISEKDLNRARNLVKASAVDNPAHGQFLTGIVVNFDLTLTDKVWIEMERYRFLNFVSSQSTMHKISKFDLNHQYCEYVDERMIGIMKELVDKYNQTKDEEDYLRVLYSNPSGFTLTARVTTNYRCLRNIYQQRKNHKLPEWRNFCKWIESLPYAEIFLVNSYKEEEELI